MENFDFWRAITMVLMRKKKKSWISRKLTTLLEYFRKLRSQEKMLMQSLERKVKREGHNLYGTEGQEQKPDAGVSMGRNSDGNWWVAGPLMIWRVKTRGCLTPGGSVREGVLNFKKPVRRAKTWITDTKGYRRFRATRTRIHLWWDCKVV